MSAQEITAHVKPEYVGLSADHTVTFSCRVPGKADDGIISWANPANSDGCPFDCYHNDPFACYNIGSLVQQCWCNDNVEEGASYCPAGTTNVTFQFTVSADYIGTWTCRYDQLKYDVELKLFGKLIIIIANKEI